MPQECLGHIQRWCCMLLHSSDRCLSIGIQMSCPLNFTSLLGRGRRIHTCICIILYCIVLYIYHVHYNCCCQWDLSNHAPISIHALTTTGYYLVDIGSVLCECAYFMAVPYIYCSAGTWLHALRKCISLVRRKLIDAIDGNVFCTTSNKIYPLSYSMHLRPRRMKLMWMLWLFWMLSYVGCLLMLRRQSLKMNSKFLRYENTCTTRK